LALTPRKVLPETLGLPDSVLGNLPEEKPYLKLGCRNLTALAGNPNGTAAYEPSGQMEKTI
jgi:hypothetical protein